MNSLFISHSSEDAEVTQRIADRLRGEGYESIFLDFDPELGISAGKFWEKELYAQLRMCDAIVFVATVASCSSRWCFAELALARSLSKVVVALRLEREARHPLLKDTQWIDLPAEDEKAFQRLWTSLKSLGLDPRDSLAWDRRRSPYPGLASFQQEDGAVFFGRQPEIDKLLDCFQRKLSRNGQGVAIIGRPAAENPPSYAQASSRACNACKSGGLLSHPFDQATEILRFLP